MQPDGNRLVESRLWTDRLELSDTWRMRLLYVPVLDSTGKVRGLCGMEMSNLYFRLSYPMVEGSCGNIVTVLAPVDKKKETSIWIRRCSEIQKKRIFHHQER